MKLSLSLLLAGVSISLQAQINFTRIARANDAVVTTVPGTNTAFQSFNHVATDGTNIVFWGSDVNQHEGIYAWNGTMLLRIADKNSTPDGKTISNFYQDPTVSRGFVAFGAFRSGGSPYAGIFTGAITNDPPVANEVDTQDAVQPTELGDGTYHLEPQAILSGNDLSLRLTHFAPGGEPFNTKHVGLFKTALAGRGPAAAPPLQVALHPEATNSGLGTDVISKMVSHDSGTVGLVLETEFFEQKLVSSQINNLTVIAQQGDSPPALGGDSFTFFPAGPNISLGKAVFVANFGSKQGLFLVPATSSSLGVLKIADTDTVAPGTTGTFVSFGSIAFERRAVIATNAGFTNYTYPSETVIFSAYVDSPVSSEGLYMWQNGKLSKLLSKNDIIAGTSKVDGNFTQFKLSSQSLVNGRLALEIENAGNTFNANLFNHEVFTAMIPPAPFPGGFPKTTVSFDSINGVCFEFIGTVGESYTVQYSDTLPAVWMTLTNFVYSAPLIICDPPPNPPSRYYRTISP